MSLVTMRAAIKPVQPVLVTEASSWASLPGEVRQMILVMVTLPNYRSRYDCLGALKLARFTAVCREWQVFFETRTFRRLVLGTDSLDEFRAISERDDTRLGYIRKLWLRVQLPEYKCRDCDEPEDEARQICNNIIFTKSIQCLLGTLQLWDPARHGGEGVALMLSATSPSDTDYRSQRCEIQDYYPFHYVEDLNIAPGIVDFHRKRIANPSSCYLHHGCPPPLGNGHIRRLQGAPLRLQVQKDKRGRFISAYKTLLAVPMIKGLVMRRQFWRNIHVEALSWLLDRSFVALEWFRFERTASLNSQEQILFDKGFKMRLLPSLPRTLSQFSFTQWKIPRNHPGIDLEEVGSEASTYAQVHQPQEMAKLSFRIEQLCPPWQMDTADFLQSIISLGKSPEMSKGSLKRLILNCLLPSSERSRQDFESLAVLAARAAILLPQLEAFELWGICVDGEETHAYILFYSYEDGRANLVWRSCEHEESMAAQARIVARWSEVAQKHSDSSLAYESVPIPETKAEIRRSDGTCLYKHLQLRDLALDPITRTILENESYGWRGEEGSNSSHQNDPTALNLTYEDSWGGNLSMGVLGSDTDLVSLQTDVISLDAEIKAFVRKHRG